MKSVCTRESVPLMDTHLSFIPIGPMGGVWEHTHRWTDVQIANYGKTSRKMWRPLATFNQ